MEGEKSKCILKGVIKFDEKYNTDNADIVIRLPLLNREGARVDEHVVLSCGSKIDELCSASVTRFVNNKQAGWMVARANNNEKYWLAGGLNARGEAREASKITKINKETGELVNFWSNSAVATCRNAARDIAFRLLALVNPPEEDNTPTLAKMLKSKSKLESKINELSNKVALADEKSSEYANLLALLDAPMAELVKLEGDIAKMLESSKKSNPAELESKIDEIKRLAREKASKITAPAVNPDAPENRVPARLSK